MGLVDEHQELYSAIASAYGELVDTSSVVLAGSRASSASDSLSDVDLYVYSVRPLQIAARQAIGSRFGQNLQIDNQFWESGDEWDIPEPGVHLDIIFRTQSWIERELENVLHKYQASLGYTTCLWYNVLHSRSLFDRAGWFHTLQDRCLRPFPEALRAAIIAKNFPVLGSISSSYIHQLELALARRDLVSINHRVSAFLAGYFDVVFAVNRLPHPGEKRLLTLASETCTILPEQMAQDIDLIISSAPMDGEIVAAAKRAEQRLRKILESERLL